MPDGRMFSYDICAESPQPLHFEAVQWFIDNYTLVTFNGHNYDVPMIQYAMSGADVHALKRLNDQIIMGGLKPWDFRNAYPHVQPLRNLDHIDVMEVAPGVRMGLKTYMARMHSRTLWDLPFDPSAPMPVHMRAVTDEYCGNDLTGTHELAEVCAERVTQRIAQGQKYGVDLRSKSDAQMAEAIIKARLPFKPEKRIVPHGYRFQYEPAPWLQFSTPTMQAVYDTVLRAVFVVNDVDQVKASTGLEEVFDTDGKKIKTGVRMPDELRAMKIPIGRSVYQFGIGGIHSTESSVSHRAIPGVQTVSDHDVASYYPSMILLLRMFPQQLGPAFLEVYEAIYRERLAAKALAPTLPKDSPEYAAVKTDEAGLKVTLNGSFGKLLSKHSVLFAPELGMRVTITGQLSLLMLIESLELADVPCVSANTDGIVLVTPHGREAIRDRIIAEWMHSTGLAMEETQYRAIHMRDVNNYIAIKPDGSHKGKGAFAASGVLNNVHPERDICIDAVVAYLKDGTPIATTVRACTDIRKFILIRNVKGGGYDQTGRYLGKTVRWYYAAGETGALRYKPKEGQTVGNVVAGSTGARECMTLPDTMPADVDYAHYEAEAVKMLGTLGAELANR